MIKFVNKKQQKNRKKNIIIFLIFVFLLFIISFGFFNSLNNVTNNTARPIWKNKNFFIKKIQSIGYFFDTKNYLFNENQRLVQDNENFKITMADYQILKNENLQLKEILGRIPEPSNFVLGTILTKTKSSPYDTLIVDIGLDTGLKGGEKVYAQAKTPIGTIGEVYKKTAQVILYSNPNNQIQVMINGFDTVVSLVGRGGGNFEMTTPIDFEVPDNALVFFPGLESEIVAVRVGVLSKITDLNKKYLLRSIVNTQNLKFVQIKKN